MPRIRMTPPATPEDGGRSDGDVLGNEFEAVLPVERVAHDKFEAIVPSGKDPGPQPAEADEFEDILPSVGGLATHDLSSHGNSATLLQQAQIETEEANDAAALKKSATDKRYADKVTQKPRCATLAPFPLILFIQTKSLAPGTGRAG